MADAQFAGTTGALLDLVDRQRADQHQHSFRGLSRQPVDGALAALLGHQQVEHHQARCPRGDRHDFYRGRKLEATKLDIAIPWPATVGVVLIMGEEDSGGFNQMVQDGYKAIEDEVKKKLNELGVKAGEAIGGELGAVIGAAIGAVLGAFVDWLVSLFNTRDDFINSKSWMVQLPSPELAAIKALASDHLPAPAGIWASPMKKLTFVGDGGKYETRLHWRVTT